MASMTIDRLVINIPSSFTPRQTIPPRIDSQALDLFPHSAIIPSELLALQ